MSRISDSDLRTLLFCSVRYATGRHSYMPSLVQEIVREHADVLTVGDRAQIADEIEDGRGLGAPVDANGWRDFCKWLREEPA